MVQPKPNSRKSSAGPRSNSSSDFFVNISLNRLPLLMICGLVLMANVFVGQRGILGAVKDATGFTNRIETSVIDAVSGADRNSVKMAKDEQARARNKEAIRQRLIKRQEDQLKDEKGIQFRPQGTNTEGVNNNESSRMALQKGLRKQGPKKRQFMDFDPAFVLHYNITSSGTSSFQTVQVGHQGTAVIKAIEHGLAQRRIGFPRKHFDTVAASKCLAHDNVQEAPKQLSRPAEFTKLPQAMLIGVQKGGTTALYQYLDQHPKVARSTKELYFMDEHLDGMILQNRNRYRRQGIPQYESQRRYQRTMTDALHVQTAVSGSGGKVQSSSSSLKPMNTSDKMILDLTPHYILESDRIPARISCILPWAKLFVLFRNPIDRARSQYDMKMGPIKSSKVSRNGFGNPPPTFDQYVRNDIAALKETGVIQDWNVIAFDDFWDTPAMWEAWRTYLHSGLNAPVGMGLYALQLKPFLKLPNDLLAIRSEDLQIDTDATYQKVLDFLELPHHSLASYSQANRARRKETISNETRALLLETFEPFNQKLADLLGEDWRKVWD